jgi:hypothetical protein
VARPLPRDSRDDKVIHRPRQEVKDMIEMIDGKQIREMMFAGPGWGDTTLRVGDTWTRTQSRFKSRFNCGWQPPTH